MTSFLADDNACGRIWLQLVSKGNAIIAELMRLKDHIPPVYKLDNRADQQKYANLIDDFKYFARQEETENPFKEINSKWHEEFKENHMDLLQRFYQAFEGVYIFGSEIKSNVTSLQKGEFIGYTLDTVFTDVHAKQLLCEALYLFGVMMMVVDRYFPGLIRERLIVSYIRYSTKMTRGSKLEEVCGLLRSRGPKDNLMTKYFDRFVMPKKYVTLVISHLKSDDIYNQMTAYPNPEQQTTALASQAAMLFVCLYFAPKTLIGEDATMRSIVDRYFPDNWVISMYMGFTVNLVESWQPYSAAKKALANTLNMVNLTEVAEHHANQLSKLNQNCDYYLSEGSVTKDNILDLIGTMTTLIRDCNVTLRWLILHMEFSYAASEESKKYKTALDKSLPSFNVRPRVLSLLMNTGQLEMNVKDLVQTLLSEKSYNWEMWKQECETRLTELVEIFSGRKSLFGVQKNLNIEEWLLRIKTAISDLPIEVVPTGTIVQLIEALLRAKEFYKLGENPQINQLFTDTANNLQKMIQAAKVKEEDLINLQKVGDISYAWELIDAYTVDIQRSIAWDPSRVSMLRNTFLKLSSAVEIPLLRITTSKSADFESVSNYYYNELVIYVGKVLQVIPEKMFKLLWEIVHLQTTELKEVPLRLDKDQVIEMAQLDTRMKIAKLTHEVSVLSEGVLQMKSTLVGVIRIDPKELLEDGIRKELVKKIGHALNDGLVFNPRKGDELLQKLEDLRKVMNGYRRSFEYIQDYIGMRGLKIWMDELSRVAAFYTDLEANTLKRSKLQPWESLHYNKFIPIPQFKPLDQHSETCMGRLLRELIRITKPTETNYNTSTTTWYDVKKTKEGKLRICADMSLFKMINSAVGLNSLKYLDNLLCLMISSELQSYFALIKTASSSPYWQEFFASLLKELPLNTSPIDNPSRVYTKWVSKAIDLSNGILEKVLKIGQLQLLRNHIFLEKKINSKCVATRLHNVLHNLNRMVLIEERSKETTKFAVEVVPLLEQCGMNNPLKDLLVTTHDPKYFSLINFLLVATQVPRLKLNRDAGWMVGNQLDGWPLVIGVQTLFKQVHCELNEQFIKYMTQYIHSYIKAFTSSKAIEKEQKLPHEVAIGLSFLMQYCEVFEYCRKKLEEDVPEIFLSLYSSLISDSA